MRPRAQGAATSHSTCPCAARCAKLWGVKSIADLLDQTAALPLNSEARRRLETRVLDETEITNFNQLAAFVEALALSAALENGAGGDEDSAEALFAQAQTISDALRRLHELIQELA